MDFDANFRRAVGGDLTPYPYQRRLALEGLPDALEAPTGLGKTAAVTLAWLHRRQTHPDETPRRLVWCLPMRVLVEQTASSIRRWLQRLGRLGAPGDPGTVSVHVLMGGESELRSAAWTRHPEQEAILVGTQDMLLSRALMRGYGMSRYQWPVHFALLHNDAQWVFDEVQLMGPALATSTQLEAFRRSWDNGTPAHSLWMSATIRSEWLGSVDFRPHLGPGMRTACLGEGDHAADAVRARVCAPKSLCQADTRLTAENARRDAQEYARALAAETLEAHRPGQQTLVIVNRVSRAQALYREIRAAAGDTETLLLHARFRPAERRAIEEQLWSTPGRAGRIVVATQAVEAGVDIDSRILITELAPWASLVQRFGRCNRAGQLEQAEIFWVDIEKGADELVQPYDAASLHAARERVRVLTSASPADLPAVTDGAPHGQVLRRRDLLGLFNTEPDLSGFDIDIAPYVRDSGTPPVRVFWRAFDGEPGPDEPGPAREELCPVSIGQLRAHLGHKGRPAAWRLDPLAGHGERRWIRVERAADVRPGQTLLLASTGGGYEAELGFLPGARPQVPVLDRTSADAEGAEVFDADLLNAGARWLPLDQHLADVANGARRLSEALGLPSGTTYSLVTAAWWHDVGKAHEAFVRGLGAQPDNPEGPWAKSPGGGRPDYHVMGPGGTRIPRPRFRHELASALAWLANDGQRVRAAERDLVAYLVAAHHGRVRLALRALPGEVEPPEPERLFARGVWHGDRIPGLTLGGTHIPNTELRLDVMRLGGGDDGPSWSERTQRLLAEHGPFGLAWLEALLRIADWRASAAETSAPSVGAKAE